MAGRHRLPLAQLVSPRSRSTIYGMSAIDCNGRLADNCVIVALSWVAGTRLAIRERSGLVQVTGDAQAGTG